LPWPQKHQGRFDGIEAPFSRIHHRPIYFIIAFFGAFLAAFFAFFAINLSFMSLVARARKTLSRPFLPTVSRIRGGVVTVKKIPQKDARRD